LQNNDFWEKIFALAGVKRYPAKLILIVDEPDGLFYALSAGYLFLGTVLLN
jgi:hypothetical protein